MLPIIDNTRLLIQSKGSLRFRILSLSRARLRTLNRNFPLYLLAFPNGIRCPFFRQVTHYLSPSSRNRSRPHLRIGLTIHHPRNPLFTALKQSMFKAQTDVNINPHEPLNGAIHHEMKAGESISEALTADIFSYPAALSSPISMLPRSLPAALINASTGYGKTTFAINTLRQKAFSDGYYVLLIQPLNTQKSGQASGRSRSESI